MDPLLSEVHALVSKVAGAERTPAGAGPSTPLGEHGFWLDSMEMFEVLIACDEALGPFSPPLADTPEALDTLGSLAVAIRARRPGGSPG